MKPLITPLNSLRAPWHIAAARRAFVAWATFPIIWSEAFWGTWAKTYRPLDAIQPKR